MKTSIFNALLFTMLVFMSCKDKTVEYITYKANMPVYMSVEEHQKMLKSSPARELVRPGKIFYKDNYIFINEFDKGIHVINNHDPEFPVNEMFIEIPGNEDIAIKGNILYANAYSDLVSMDISNLSKPVEISRVRNAFPNTFPVGDNKYPYTGTDYRKGILVGWKIEEYTEKIEKSNLYYYTNEMLASPAMSKDAASSSVTGIAGSMAKFMIKDNVLYTLNNWYLKYYNISSSTEIKKIDSLNVNVMSETLFLLKNNLFLGSTTGMLIFDVSNSNRPIRLSTYQHFTSCDPVVAEGDYAYVTLRSGTQCSRGLNQLDVINISDLTKPTLLKSYPMSNPQGLGIDNGLLFICDAVDGLKIYDAKNPLSITDNLLAQFRNIKAFDVIPFNQVLMIIGEEGLYQYSYADVKNIKLLSTLKINRPVVNP